MIKPSLRAECLPDFEAPLKAVYILELRPCIFHLGLYLPTFLQPTMIPADESAEHMQSPILSCKQKVMSLAACWDGVWGCAPSEGAQGDNMHNLQHKACLGAAF